MKLTDDFPCDLQHPILEIIDSETRRQILQLIATETNYGNRLANILNLSSPAIHRHLKRLESHEVRGQEISILKKKRVTRESYSGHKGAKATIYEIMANYGLFFGIFPNFIHSQVVQIDEGGDPVERELIPENYNSELFGVDISKGSTDEDCIGEECFTNHINEIHKLNKKIKSTQEALMSQLYMKNVMIDNVFRSIESADDLNFQERVVLKSLIAYGLNNLNLITQLLDSSEGEIMHVIQSLKEKQWIIDKKIIHKES